MGIFKGLVVVSLFILMSAIPVWGMGVTDFVAVVDGPTAAIYNPAGLLQVNNRIIKLEHRLTGRDFTNLNFGYDELFIYAAPGMAGNGAVFVTYSQDLIVVPDYYSRLQSIGYAYSWAPLEQISLGVSGKYYTSGYYSDLMGVMVKQSSSTKVIFDLGLLAKLTPNAKVGLAIHNLGKSDQMQSTSHETTVGFSYRLGNQVVAGEIQDLLNESGVMVYRGGLRLQPFDWLRLHLEYSLSSTDFTSQAAGLEFKLFKKLFTEFFWYSASSQLFRGELYQLAVGYSF